MIVQPGMLRELPVLWLVLAEETLASATEAVGDIRRKYESWIWPPSGEAIDKLTGETVRESNERRYPERTGARP